MKKIKSIDIFIMSSHLTVCVTFIFASKVKVVPDIMMHTRKVKVRLFSYPKMCTGC
jgi:hypothetical protein